MESLNPKSFCIYFVMVALLTLIEEKSDSIRSRVTLNCLSFCVPYKKSLCSAACLIAYSADRAYKAAMKDKRLALTVHSAPRSD